MGISRRLSLLSLLTALVLSWGCLPEKDDGDRDTPRSPIVCQPWDCGRFADFENYWCDDGETLAGPTGECIKHADGTCGWETVSCPVPTECELGACGPPLAMPNWLCPDGRTLAGPTGVCRMRGGECGWEVRSCPPGVEYCQAVECGEAPVAATFLCPDGTTVAGPTGNCMQRSDGSCEWEVVVCPGRGTN